MAGALLCSPEIKPARLIVDPTIEPGCASSSMAGARLIRPLLRVSNTSAILIELLKHVLQYALFCETAEEPFSGCAKRLELGGFDCLFR